MFPSDGSWKGAMFGAVIGGIITVVLLKLWEKIGAALGKLERASGAGEGSKKRPTENDERFCSLQQVGEFEITMKKSK